MIDFFDVTNETLDKLNNGGALLIAGTSPNPMTIGWATLGQIWGKKIMTILVRPTRYTFGIMEQAKGFAVCILPDSFQNELQFCGTHSGRDIDKISACRFTMHPCFEIETQFIENSLFHFECRIVHKHPLDAGTLNPEIISKYYPIWDFHMVYYGEILGIYGK